MNLVDELEREKAHSDGMKAAAEMWMAKALQLERDMLHSRMALVEAAGGEIVLSRTALGDLPGLELIMHEEPHNNTIVLRTRRKDPSNKTA